MIHQSTTRIPPFDLAKFIIESNYLDPQYDAKGRFIPGDKERTQMFKNQKRAFNLLAKLAVERPTPLDLVLRIHSALTRGIDVYDNAGTSGKYRDCAVYLGKEKELKFPSPQIAKRIIEESLIPEIEKIRDLPLRGQDVYKAAWRCHHIFVCAHPFVDGNGRTGRLLLNFVIGLFNHEMLVVYEERRSSYYRAIRDFQRKIFPNVLASMDLTPSEIRTTLENIGAFKRQRHSHPEIGTTYEGDPRYATPIY